MKFKVGQIWRNGHGEEETIRSITGVKEFNGVKQPIETDKYKCYTIEGWYGRIEDRSENNDLVCLVRDVSEQALSSRKWTPGQSLNPKEVFTALAAGEKLRIKLDWDSHEFIF